MLSMRNYKAILTRKERADRAKLIYEYRKEGNSLAVVGQRFGVSRERVRQIEEKFKELELSSELSTHS